MKFYVLDLELHLPQILCHTQIDILKKSSNRVREIQERLNPSKTGSRKFQETNTFFYQYRRQ